MYNDSLTQYNHVQYRELNNESENIHINTMGALLDNIIYRCQDFMNNDQLINLDNVLTQVMKKYELKSLNKEYAPIDYKEENLELINKFIQAKSLEGCTQSTIEAYQTNVDKFLQFTSKSLKEISPEDVRNYLKYKMTVDNVSNSYADTILRYLRTTFKWLCDEGYVYINPTTIIPKIRSMKKVKEPLTSMEIEQLRDYFKTKPNREIDRLRNTAIFELLLSSGIRISELTQLNKMDIDWRERSFIVLGKGMKERKCYFNIKTQMILHEYLNARDDDIEALFINSKKVKVDRRLSVNSIERLMRNAGKTLNIHVHPHKLRRTFATNLLRKGVPLEEVRSLLGHSNLETTTLYAIVDDEQLKLNHKRLMD